MMRSPISSTILRRSRAMMPLPRLTAAAASQPIAIMAGRAGRAASTAAAPTLGGDGGSDGDISLGSRPLSNPTLANIEKRWEGMPLQEQAELWMRLRDRMKGNWHELTVQEKKAAYWIAFGPHGPRAKAPKDFQFQVFMVTMAGLGASALIFGVIRYFAKPVPHTMSKEWQEASNEYLKAQNSDPLHGISSEGYSGKGMVQSPPKGR